MLPIRVRKKKGPAALFHLNSQREIDDLLAVLIALRADERSDWTTICRE